ncbi:hypothetical protein BDN70DRAFT_995700 [Pholiota conissans]|uniref:Uncharacterized protein n=1 Tax=Pholiota conissans TaxID=109636 RepID=A0A9P5YVE4_9AGAR|nr:hypothetical protein BDN70DRAFT_995700 [Pholiota conissans]
MVNMPHGSYRFPALASLRIPSIIGASLVIVVALVLPAAAQAPVNDVISWPAGLLLLASILYSALGQNCEQLWDIDPSIGPFLGSGLPSFSLPIMRRINWVSPTCHFVPSIRSAHGVSNFWIRSEEVSSMARSEALKKASSLIHCVIYEQPQSPIDESLWKLTPAGLVRCADTPLAFPSPPIKLPHGDHLSAHDFLLFAATDYHAFRDWEVNIFRGDQLLFSTKGMPASSVVDVDSEDAALAVVAAQMVRRPHSQTFLRNRAQLIGSDASGPYNLDLNGIDLDMPICAIDFHSYSPDSSKVSASLRELARSYFRIVQHIKGAVNSPDWLAGGPLAKINVGQTLWIAILGGALLDTGRLTIQNLPGRWAVKDVPADEAYLTRVEGVLQAVEPYLNTNKFFDLVFSGGTSRRVTYPFLLAGLFGQMIICYFLSVGTSAGVWTSVALSNALYVGKLTDWHSLFFGRINTSSEPGMKMYLPDSPSKELMAIATLNRSSPREKNSLRPGFLVNTCGLVAAMLGSIFQEQTRVALGFGPSSPTANWVVYTSIALSSGTSLLILITIVLQQRTEHTWSDNSETPTRWAVYSTLSASFIASALAAFFIRCEFARLWPILDVLAWLSGFPLGLLENGRMVSMDDNMLHLILLNRWIIGAVASSVGSSAANAQGVYI